MSVRKRSGVPYSYVCSGLEEADRLREKLQRAEAALAAIAALEYVYLKDWDASAEAGISDARDIARLYFDAEKDTERTGFISIPEVEEGKNDKRA
jgi:hypothetical protein